MMLVKNLIIFYLSILGKKGENNTFYDILERKNVNFDNKNKKLKKSKNSNFSKGGSPWVSSKKIKIFPSSYLMQNKPGKCVHDILHRKNAFLDY